MKYLTLIFLLFSGTAFSAALDSCHSGSWYSTDRIGEGISVEVGEKTVVVYFFTYSNTERDWYIMQGDRVAVEPTELAIYGTMKESEDPFTVAVNETGRAFLDAIDDNTLVFSFHHVLDHRLVNSTPWCLADYCDGSYEYTRLTRLIACPNG